MDQLERVLDKLDKLASDVHELRTEYASDYASMRADQTVLRDTVKRLEDAQKQLIEGFRLKEGTIIKVTLIICVTTLACIEGGSPILASLMKLLGV